jgi:FkbM family methyltransferase
MKIKDVVRKKFAFVVDYIHASRGYSFLDYFAERHRIEALIYANEPDVLDLLKTMLTKGMTVIYVGGNVALISGICADKVGSMGRVWTFEPDLCTRKFLEYNVSRCSKVMVSPISLSDQNSIARLHIHPASGASNSIPEFEAESHSVEVECRTLDSFLDEHPVVRLDWVKIAFAGAEPRDLRGMRESLMRNSQLFLTLKFWPMNLVNGGDNPVAVFELLSEHGLAAAIIAKDGNTETVTDLNDLTEKLDEETYCDFFCVRSSGLQQTHIFNHKATF